MGPFSKAQIITAIISGASLIGALWAYGAWKEAEGYRNGKADCEAEVLRQAAEAQAVADVIEDASETAVQAIEDATETASSQITQADAQSRQRLRASQTENNQLRLRYAELEKMHATCRDALLDADYKLLNDEARANALRRGSADRN